MSAPMLSTLKRFGPSSSSFLTNKLIFKYSSRTAFFWKKNKEEEEILPTEVRKPQSTIDGPITIDRLASLKKQTSVRTVRGYRPPDDVSERIEEITCQMCGSGDWKSVSLKDDRRLKFKLLTRLIKEFDHDVSSQDLHNMHNVSDIITYFNTEVRDTSTYEDLSKLDLPKNLHIQLDHVQFDAENDTMFGGVSAYDQKTHKSRSRYDNSDA